jgi:hypothetical protein
MKVHILLALALLAFGFVCRPQAKRTTLLIDKCASKLKSLM